MMKNINLSIHLVWILLLAIGNILNLTASVQKLQVEYQTNPLGIDISQPRFSWQMKTDRTGAAQMAYQLLVAESPEQLDQGEYLYDTGKVNSGESVGIPYQGKILQPATRYYWKVKVWDETGVENDSVETAWFETGLLGSGWNNARWIGSSIPQLSRYRSQFVLDWNVRIPKGNDRAVFIWGARDPQNYVAVELNLNGKGNPELILRHVTDGKETEDARVDLSNIIPAAEKQVTHRIRLDVTTAQYALKYFTDIYVNGKELINTSISEEERRRKKQPDYWGSTEGAFTIYPYPDGDLQYLCRLYAIGFLQPPGQTAEFSDITVREKVWGANLYTSGKTYLEKGTGTLNIWEPAEKTAAPLFRKEFRVEKTVKQARLYATARGIYEFSINGEKVGKDYFNPGWTDYRYRIMYNTYDITPLLKTGANAIGAMLGTGWWSDHSGFMTGWQDQYGIRESFLGKIVIKYTDGSKETIVTDNSWKCYDKGPITSNSFQNGEDYDARREVKGWNEPGFYDGTWSPVDLLPPPPVSVLLQGYVGNPVQHNRTLTAQSVVEPLPGVYVYDMGQNMVGVPRLNLKGKAGQQITIRFGEMNYPGIIPTDPVAPYTIDMYEQKKGQVYTDNYRSALSTNHYIMKGDPVGEIYEPRFTFHGYRYIELHGLDQPLALEDVKGIVLESIGEQTSGYETSNQHINRLYENIIWGQLGNFLSVPTDCPQRDERMGWTGDAQVFARTATYNMNVNPFFTRWLYSVRDNQGTDGSYANFVPVVAAPPQGANPGGGAMGWMEAGIIVPWQMYQQYNDVGILQQHYASMVAYMDYLERRAVHYIQPFGGFGDWLALEPTNSMMTNTAYAAYDALIMEQIALRLGKEEDANRFRTFYDHIKQVFNEIFVDEEGYTYTPKASSIFGEGAGGFAIGVNPEEAKRVDTQTSYVVPLQFGLFNEKNKPLAVKHLVESLERTNYTLTTGFIGTPYLNMVLSDNGQDEIAYKLFEQTAYPSWLYPVLQGATTIWERWNSYTIVNGFGPVDMNSFNHYSYGAIQDWMMAYTLGIQRDETRPGYKHIMLQPRIGGEFTFIRGHYDSVYGRIESGWEKEGGRYIYRVIIPANTTATLRLPALDSKAVDLAEGEQGVTERKYNGSHVTYEVTAGSYTIHIY